MANLDKPHDEADDDAYKASEVDDDVAEPVMVDESFGAPPPPTSPMQRLAHRQVAMPHRTQQATYS
jgi:hypothetical protein